MLQSCLNCYVEDKISPRICVSTNFLLTVAFSRIINLKILYLSIRTLYFSYQNKERANKALFNDGTSFKRISLRLSGNKPLLYDVIGMMANLQIVVIILSFETIAQKRTSLIKFVEVIPIR